MPELESLSAMLFLVSQKQILNDNTLATYIRDALCKVTIETLSRDLKFDEWSKNIIYKESKEIVKSLLARED